MSERKKMGGDRKSKNASSPWKYRDVDTGKIATMREHVDELLQVFTRADRNVVQACIYRHGTYYGRRFERVEESAQ